MVLLNGGGGTTFLSDNAGALSPTMQQLWRSFRCLSTSCLFVKLAQQHEKVVWYSRINVPLDTL